MLVLIESLLFLFLLFIIIILLLLSLSVLFLRSLLLSFVVLLGKEYKIVVLCTKIVVFY